MQKIILLCILLVWTVNIYADYQTVKIKDVSVEYRDPIGQILGSEIEIPSKKNDSNAVRIDIVKSGTSIAFIKNGLGKTWKDAPTYFLETDNLDANNFNFVAQNNMFVMSLDYASRTAPFAYMNLSGFSLTCPESSSLSSDETWGKKIVRECFVNATLDVDRFRQSDDSNSSSCKKSVQGDISIDSLSLVNRDHAFKLELIVNWLIFYGKAKLSGKIYYDQERKKIHIVLQKAKLGFIDIKEKIFQKVEDSGCDFLIVERPNIYIQL